jgi:hypothetical protein
VYCFTCLLAGPAFEYNDYVNAINGDAFKREGIVDDDGESEKPPSSIMAALSALVVGAVSLIVYLKMSVEFPMQRFYNPDFIASHGKVYRMIYTWLSIFGERFKYYFVWKVAEGSCILAGFGFEGFDKMGQPKGWRGVRNVDVLIVETAPNVQLLTRSWNKRTQGWLERYTYKRTGNSLMATYFISALWHGLYPGFFFLFMSMPLLTNIERLTRLKINPVLIPGYDGKSNN